LKAKELLESVRRELMPLNERILNHPYIVDAEEGRLPLEKVKLFVGQQYYIVSHDVKSLAIMVSRAEGKEVDYFTLLLQGDLQALSNLIKMASSLGLSVQDLEDFQPIPEASAYTHYLTFLANYGTAGEQAFALVVNLPVWGSACGRLAKSLKAKYGVTETSFLEAFASVPEWVESQALEIVEPYLPKVEQRIRRAAKLIQSYELMFWDGIYR